LHNLPFAVGVKPEEIDVQSSFFNHGKVLIGALSQKSDLAGVANRLGDLP